MPKAAVLPPIDQLIAEYHEGASIRELHKTYKTTQDRIRRIFLKHNVKIRSSAESRIIAEAERRPFRERKCRGIVLSEARINSLILAYQNEGLSLPKIKQRFGIHPSTARALLKEASIPIRDISEARKEEWAALDARQRQERGRAIRAGKRAKKCPCVVE